MKKRETLKNAAFFAVILILVLVFLISGLHILESTVLQNGDIQETTGKKTIVRNGVDYKTGQSRVPATGRPSFVTGSNISPGRILP